jgi:hypothetical protein
MVPANLLDEKLKSVVEDMGLPPLVAGQRTCTECEKPIGSESVRSFGLNLNAQYVGDLVVDIYCNHCRSGYSLHYRRTCSQYGDFLDLLQKDPGSLSSVAEHNIKPHENNLFELMNLEEKGKENEPN